MVTTWRLLCVVTMLVLVEAQEYDAELAVSNEIISVKDVHVDQNSTVHVLYAEPYSHAMMYTKYVYPSQRNYKLTNENITSFLSARWTSATNGSVLYAVFNGLRRCGLQRCFDVWTSQTSMTYHEWSSLRQVPRPVLNDNCHRYGDAIILTREQQLFVFYHLECPNVPARLCFVKRALSSPDFSAETVLYEDGAEAQIRTSVTAEWTMQMTTTVVHVFWAATGTSGSIVLYSNTTDQGQSWSVPRKISGSDNYSGFRMLTSVSKADLHPNWLLGMYGVSPPGPLRLFASQDHGATFALSPGLTTPQDRYSWEYDTNALCLAGTTQKPVLIALTQTNDTNIEGRQWDLSKMTTKTIDPVFQGVRAFGVQVACLNVPNSGRITIWFYCLSPIVREDKKVHLMLSSRVLYQ